MFLREYQPEDCAELAELFYNTVHTVNAKDYTEEQLNVWASGTVDLEAWNLRYLNTHTVIAVEEDTIAGFGNIDSAGYVDMLYVHKDYQKRGVASMICDHLENTAVAQKFTTHASITAKPFFEKRGYHAVREQQVERGGIFLTNYVMEKSRAVR